MEILAQIQIKTIQIHNRKFRNRNIKPGDLNKPLNIEKNLKRSLDQAKAEVNEPSQENSSVHYPSPKFATSNDFEPGNNVATISTLQKCGKILFTNQIKI